MDTTQPTTNRTPNFRVGDLVQHEDLPGVLRIDYICPDGSSLGGYCIVSSPDKPSPLERSVVRLQDLRYADSKAVADLIARAERLPQVTYVELPVKTFVTKAYDTFSLGGWKFQVLRPETETPELKSSAMLMFGKSSGEWVRVVPDTAVAPRFKCPMDW